MRKIFLSFFILAWFALFAGWATAESPGSLLRHAASKGDLATVRAELDAGVAVDAQNSGGGETALKLAAMGGHTAIVKLLIERGADIDQALSLCEDTIEWGKENSNTTMVSEGRQCVATLRSFKARQDEAKRQEQEIAKDKAIEAQKAKEMKEIIKEVIAGTAKTQKQEANQPPAIQSDIDRPAFSQTEKIMGDNDLAVIIGIEGYQSLPKSDYSYDDAKLVKEYARALGFKERNIELITDEKATKSSIEKTLEAWLKNKAKSDSRVFVYYSGHGAPEPKTGDAYIVPFDGDPNYLEVTGYPLKRLYDRLGKLQAGEVIVLLDSCFSGAGGRSVLAKGARPLVMMAESAILPQNMAVLSATQGTQISTSSPEKEHGVFTYYFLKALKDGKKNIAEIYEYIKPLIEDEAKQLNVQQSPSVNPDVEKLKGRFGLRR